MKRAHYAWLLRLLTPLIVAAAGWRAWRRPPYRERFRERFGFGPSLAGPVLWVHAVSVGEAIAAVPLVQALRERHPQHRILMTTVTPTGAATVRTRLGGIVEHRYAPYDLPGAVRRFFRRVQPSLGIIMETEVWPNLFHEAARRGVPLALVNARLSERSRRGYARFRGVVGPALQDLAVIAAQSAEDADAFRDLGAAHVWVTGNLKFDAPQPPDTLVTRARLRGHWGERPVWVFGSTHEGEEALGLQAFATLRERFPDLLLVLVPRHPERGEGVARLVEEAGHVPARRSRGEWGDGTTAVLLADTLGELSDLYAAADVVTVGGSFVPVGGHNVLEAAMLGRPVCYGPHMENFREIATLMEGAGAAQRLKDVRELTACLEEWLGDPATAQAVGAKGRALMAAHRGALARTLAVLPAL